MPYEYPSSFIKGTDIETHPLRVRHRYLQPHIVKIRNIRRKHRDQPTEYSLRPKKKKQRVTLNSVWTCELKKADMKYDPLLLVINPFE